MIKFKKIWRFFSNVLSLSEIKTIRKKPIIKRHSSQKRKRIGESPSILPETILLWGVEKNLSSFPTIFSMVSLDQFLVEELRTYAQPLLKRYARKLGYSSVELTIKPVKSMWGRCTRDNRILLNRDLVHLDKNIVKYVIVHEVAHLREKNHQKPFRDLVAYLLPDYRIWQSALKKQIPLSRTR